MPHGGGLSGLREAAAGCKACPLWRGTTQTVFGEGPASATVMMVGEQPGDQEDRRGHPFVGPAGRILDEALQEAGVERRTVYVTNAVKHFKYTPQGKRRIHKKPNVSEMAACKPWLEAEIQRVKPAMIVALGATAAQTLLGPATKITQIRGTVQSSQHGSVIATAHPSSILRQRDDESRHAAMRDLVRDLRLVAGQVAKRIKAVTG